MPPLSISWLRGGRSESISSASWLATPSQRAVRVLQVTQANWHVLPGGRRKKHRGGGMHAALVPAGH